jgi:hypothetical protein
MSIGATIGRHDAKRVGAKLVGARLAVQGVPMRGLLVKDWKQKKAGPKRARLEVLAT